MTAPTAIVTAEHLSFSYKGTEKPALGDISFSVRRGDFLGITGRSGAGKTTLIRALAGVVPHFFPGDFYGSVHVDGFDTVETQPEQIARVAGSVFQDIEGQLIASEVEDEILFGLENFGIPREEIEERLSWALSVTGISALRERAVAGLSGGQKQKVAIASIIALRPPVILLDEPTGELDPQSSVRVFETLRELNKRYGITIIAAEQKIDMLRDFASRLLVMDSGRVVAEGPAESILRQSGVMESAGLGTPISRLSGRLRELGLYNGIPPINIEEAREMVINAVHTGI